MALPVFSIAEMRLFFKSCAQPHRVSRIRNFSSTVNKAKNESARSNEPKRPSDGALKPSRASRTPGDTTEYDKPKKEETGLTTQKPEKKAIDRGRVIPVPLKVIPKAQIASDVNLTPRQRLHLEILTRRQPVEIKKQSFKERLQVYHMGYFKELGLTFLKMSSIVSACAVTFVFAPAHLTAGTAPWIVGLIWLGGFVPGILTHYMTKSWVNRVFLDLPEKARESPKAAMEYAKNLPPDSLIDIRYIKFWGLEGSIKAETSEFVPTKGNFLRPLSFTWRDDLVNRRPSSVFTPNTFFVEPKTAAGNSSKDTIPGIWESVYRQIMKGPAKESPKWRSPLETQGG